MKQKDHKRCKSPSVWVPRGDATMSPKAAPTDKDTMTSLKADTVKSINRNPLVFVSNSQLTCCPLLKKGNKICNTPGFLDAIASFAL